jgi:stringent starvation protein B
MISTKPYLVRAIFEWCVDQGYTPYITVSVGQRTRVPREYVKDGQIVLNVGPDATNQLLLGNDEITFQARFNGVAFPVNVPIESVAAIYAKENGHGMAFDISAVGSDASISRDMDTDLAIDSTPPHQPTGRPRLTRIK